MKAQIGWEENVRIPCVPYQLVYSLTWRLTRVYNAGEILTLRMLASTLIQHGTVKVPRDSRIRRAVDRET